MASMVHKLVRKALKRIVDVYCWKKVMSFAQRYRLRIKDLKWFTGLYQILSEFGHFKATWSVMYTFKGRYQSNSTALHPLPTRSTCPESLGQKRFTKKLDSTGNDR